MTQIIEVEETEGHFQGELYIGPCGARVEDTECHDAQRQDGALIVGHSETGHHHVVESRDARLLETNDPLAAFLVSGAGHIDLVHKREFDTHPTLRLKGRGTRKIVRQREVTPERAGKQPKWTRAAD